MGVSHIVGPILQMEKVSLGEVTVSSPCSVYIVVGIFWRWSNLSDPKDSISGREIPGAGRGCVHWCSWGKPLRSLACAHFFCTWSCGGGDSICIGEVAASFGTLKWRLILRLCKQGVLLFWKTLVLPDVKCGIERGRVREQDGNKEKHISLPYPNSKQAVLWASGFFHLWHEGFSLGDCQVPLF